MQEDPRLPLARAMSMREIVDRLPLDGLRRAGHELIGPCPKCGGRDRFGINIGRGVFNCRGCQARGDGIKLVAHVMGCDFLGALAYLCGERTEIDPAELERRKKRAEAERRRRAQEAERYRRQAIADAVQIWKRAIPPGGSPVVGYLAKRGISLPVLPKSIRFLPDHPYVRKLKRGYVTFHRGPCMVAAIQGPDDRLCAVHQTWIDLSRPDGKAEILDPESGERQNAKLVRGSKKGGAIRLGGGGSGALIMGEGIETTLSARIAEPIGPAVYWAGVDLGNMAGIQQARDGVKFSGEPDLSDAEAFVPPPWVRRLVFIQDGDSDPEKTRAQLLSGIRRAQHHIPGLTASIVHAGEGRDLNDILK